MPRAARRPDEDRAEHLTRAINHTRAEMVITRARIAELELGAAPVLVREVPDRAHVPPPIGLGILVAAAIIVSLYLTHLVHRLELADRLPDLEPQSRLLPNLERFDREQSDAGVQIVGTDTSADPLRIVGQRRTCEYCGMRHTPRRRFELRTETVRQLRPAELSYVGGGRRGTTSEDDPAGGGPCPGQYSWTCRE